MDKKSKLFLAFGAGALVGAAIVALYSTDKGKELVKKLKDQAGDLAEDLKKNFKEFESEFTDFVKSEDSKENTQV
ncbi:YtxH domain-containing protein [Aurantibacillus circumpalustris]|uniref:YtxH domain-containing protein n=1 Tax=Aurantibacillus circumpalustris TaxID=3036359 RepID=UPI00295BA8A2|nr:YtxH domain-containing protein [Aurantibacillus circumpalustris]